MLIIKILLFKLLLFFIKKIFKVKPKTNFIKSLMSDFICMTPTITIPAIIYFLNCGTVNFK
jgi:hypothetical protein